VGELYMLDMASKKRDVCRKEDTDKKKDDDVYGFMKRVARVCR
jgi:hypothetical protein